MMNEKFFVFSFIMSGSFLLLVIYFYLKDIFNNAGPAGKEKYIKKLKTRQMFSYIITMIGIEMDIPEDIFYARLSLCIDKAVEIYTNESK